MFSAEGALRLFIKYTKCSAGNRKEKGAKSLYLRSRPRSSYTKEQSYVFLAKENKSKHYGVKQSSCVIGTILPRSLSYTCINHELFPEQALLKGTAALTEGCFFKLERERPCILVVFVGEVQPDKTIWRILILDPSSSSSCNLYSSTS